MTRRWWVKESSRGSVTLPRSIMANFILKIQQLFSSWPNHTYWRLVRSRNSCFLFLSFLCALFYLFFFTYLPSCFRPSTSVSLLQVELMLLHLSPLSWFSVLTIYRYDKFDNPPQWDLLMRAYVMKEMEEGALVTLHTAATTLKHADNML